MKKICLNYFSLRGKCNKISFRGWSELNGPLKNVNKPKPDIEAIMQTFTEDILRQINTTTIISIPNF